MAKYQAPTEEERTTLCLWVKKGVHIDSALLRCGIPQPVWKYWLKQGAQGVQPYKAFVEAIDDALIKFETDLLSFIADHASRSAQAAQWLFAVRFGAKYKAMAEVEAAKWKAENGHAEHAAANKPISVEEIEAIERRALNLEDMQPPVSIQKHDPMSLEAAQQKKFGLQ